MKRLLALVLALVLCLCIGAPALALKGDFSQRNATSTPVPGSDAFVTFIPELELTIISTRVEDTDSIELASINWTPYGADKKEVVASFNNRILDRNGAVLATVTSTARGVYSLVTPWSQMLSVTATASGSFAHDIYYSSSVSGNKGYLDLYFVAEYLKTFTYTISASGSTTQTS